MLLETIDARFENLTRSLLGRPGMGIRIGFIHIIVASASVLAMMFMVAINSSVAEDILGETALFSFLAPFLVMTLLSMSRIIKMALGIPTLSYFEQYPIRLISLLGIHVFSGFIFWNLMSIPHLSVGIGVFSILLLIHLMSWMMWSWSLFLETDKR